MTVTLTMASADGCCALGAAPGAISARRRRANAVLMCRVISSPPPAAMMPQNLPMRCSRAESPVAGGGACATCVRIRAPAGTPPSLWRPGMRRTVVPRALLVIIVVALTLSASLLAGQAGPAQTGKLAISVEYTGKGTVDTEHRLWIWVFDNPDSST